MRHLNSGELQAWHQVGSAEETELYEASSALAENNGMPVWELLVVLGSEIWGQHLLQVSA